MSPSPTEPRRRTPSRSGNVIRIRGLVLATLAVLGFFLAAAYLSPLPGVISRNVAEEVDATPLFYTESERLPELEAALRDSTQTPPDSSGTPASPPAP